MRRIQLLSCFLYSFLLGCNNPKDTELISDRNRGGYTINGAFSEGIVGDSVQVFGSVYDLETRLPIPFGSVEIGCLKDAVDDSGQFELLLTKELSREAFLTAKSIGYHDIRTQSLEMNRNTIQLDFYLQLDTRPIMECPELSM